MVTRPETLTRLPDGHIAQFCVADDAAPGEIGAQERRRVRAQRQFEEAVVVHDLFARRHGRQLHVGFARNGTMRGYLRRDDGCGCRHRMDPKQRQIVVLAADAAERLGRPQRLPPREAERAEGIGVGEPFDDAR